MYHFMIHENMLERCLTQFVKREENVSSPLDADRVKSELSASHHSNPRNRPPYWLPLMGQLTVPLSVHSGTVLLEMSQEKR